jgi:hypothetical protein
MGFAALPRTQRFGILPKGTLLASPCGTFYLQLIEPDPGAEDYVWDEHLHRIGLGAPDVMAAVKALTARGIGFIDSSALHVSERGALTQSYLGGVLFELVHDEGRPPEAASGRLPPGGTAPSGRRGVSPPEAASGRLPPGGTAPSGPPVGRGPSGGGKP